VSRSLLQHLLLLANALILLASQLLLKQGLKRSGALSLTNLADLQHLIKQVLTTPMLCGGISLGMTSTILWLVILSRFELSYAMPLLNGIYYILILLASAVILGEHVTAWRWAGVALMIAGIALISGTK
jgi:multidrug transporter EmrE-like cation transporter